ncbi:alpha/beta hydrolase [Smaragdicoccus niigatensis]|uniref:alpha/beta hydrolase n=1 Tax=Smaragdicoccus niigatensis TaxID=359359 RepID=UPI000377827B|nr:alpha/beta hydrolase [Smaragdicoccus niigatensis]
MTTFALIHGSGDGGWAWHLVQRELRDRGHEAVAPDLHTDHDDATWDDCVEAVATEVGTADDVVVVGHSAGGFFVPLVAARLNARLQVFVAGLVPQPGETADEWFDHVGWTSMGSADPFYHDVPADLAAESMARERPTSAKLAASPWPSSSPPAIPARFIVTTQDGFIAPDLQRHVAASRLGIVNPEEVDAGHCANLSQPVELARILAGYVA